MNNPADNIKAMLFNWVESLHNERIVLNVAGSRESKHHGLQKEVCGLIKNLMIQINSIEDKVSEDTVEYIQTIEIPFYPDLEIACGTFKEGFFESVEMMTIDNPHGNLDPKHHFIVRASGDSMSWGNNPIFDGDLLLMEVNTGGTISNQIFAVEHITEFDKIEYV